MFQPQTTQLDHKEKAKRLRLKAKIFSLQLLAFSLSLTSFAAQPGAVDLSFDPGTGVDSLVYSIAVQTDGKVLIGGDFTTFDGAARTNVARLNSNGSRDATFDPNPGVGESFTYVN